MTALCGRARLPVNTLDREAGDVIEARVTLGPDALVLCAGTIPRAPFAERIAAARAGGFDGVSLRLGDYARARAAGLSDTDLRALLDGEGIAVAELEALAAWRPGVAPVRPGHGMIEVFDVAAAVGARSVSVVEGPGTPLPVDDAAEWFATVCDRAAAGGLLVQIEPWPGSGLDLATALAVVVAAGRPNGGLLVDTWHLARTEGGDAPLRNVPGAYITGVQVSDSPAVARPEPDYLEAALARRLVPGEGALDLIGFLRQLATIGCRAPLGAEVWSAALASEPAAAVARRVGDAMRALLLARDALS